jgi:hypothetical protein
MKKNLSRPNLLKTQIVLLVVDKSITLGSELEIIQSKLNDKFDTFYLKDEIEAELLDLSLEERTEEVVLIPENY